MKDFEIKCATTQLVFAQLRSDLMHFTAWPKETASETEAAAADFIVDNISIACSANQVNRFGHGQQMFVAAAGQSGCRIKISSSQCWPNCSSAIEMVNVLAHLFNMLKCTLVAPKGTKRAASGAHATFIESISGQRV